MVIAVVLSGGSGSRFGGSIPKQYLEIDGKPILVHTLMRLQINGNIDSIMIVADDNWKESILGWVEQFEISKFMLFAEPGITRQLSIKNALLELRNRSICDGLVMIHDAVRPFVSQELINRCIDACKDDIDGTMPVINVTDTTYICDDGMITGTLDRSRLFSGQSPEVFRLNKYYSANINATDDYLTRINGSSEIAFLSGLRIKTVEGEPTNIKITTREDLKQFSDFS